MSASLRIRYSGLLTFSLRAITIFTGMLFVILITRTIPVEDFGTWNYIGVVISYLMLPASIVKFWGSRFVPRGYKVARTMLYFNAMIAVIAVIVYIVSSPSFAQVASVNLFYFTFALPIVFLIFLIAAYDTVVGNLAPHVYSYSLVLFDTVKLVSAFFYVVVAGAGLVGALAAVSMGYLSQFVVLTYFLRKELATKLNFGIVKDWLKAAWLPVYSNVGAYIVGYDSLIVAILSGSVIPLAFWGAARAIYSLIGYSSFLYTALKPRLLAGGGTKEIELSFRLLILFALPITAGALVLSSPLLELLRREYVAADLLVKVGAFYTLVIVLVGFFDGVVKSMDKVDAYGELHFGNLLRSRLFKTISLDLIFGIAYVVSTFIIVSSAVASGTQPHMIPAYVMLGASVISIIQLVVMLKIAKRAATFSIPIVPLARYGIAAAIMCVPYLFVYPSGVSELMLAILGSAVIYFGMLYFVDDEVKVIAHEAYKVIIPKNWRV